VPVLRVTHDYHPSDAADVFEVSVSIENLSAATVDPRYRRAMDWDIPPTEFEEYVTIQGTADAANVLFASDDGFANGDPFAGPSQILFTGDAVDSGPEDHGALFDFGFTPIAPGGVTDFEIYYGAAESEVAANAALGRVEAEIYSLGQPSSPGGPDLGTPNTFLFAFAGVGGQVQFPEISGTVTDAEGDPVEGAWVLAYRDADGFAPTAVVLSAADGTYAFGDLPDGTYRIGYAPVARTDLAGEWYDGVYLRSEADPLVVTASTSTVAPHAGIDASLVETGRLTGTITGPTGAPVTGARISLYLPTDGLYSLRWTTTGADGTYTFPVPTLGAGSYKVAIRPPDGSGLRLEWFDDVATREAATAIPLGPGISATANAQLAAK